MCMQNLSPSCPWFWEYFWYQRNGLILSVVIA